MSDLKNWNRMLRRRESLAFFASCFACFLFFASGTANAVLVTGDPSVDSGWAAGGNVLDVNNYLLGNANFGFNMYSSAFTADSALASAIGSGWNAGDTILALGGKRNRRMA